jgi:ribosomal protein L40E
MAPKTKDCEQCGNPIPVRAFTCRFCGISQSLENFPKTVERVVIANLENGMPTVEHALERFRRRLSEASASGAKVLKVIHGYGSSGRGGKIRDAVRRELGRMLARGEVAAVVAGEEYSSTTIAGRDLLSRFKELKATERPDSSNHGITLVEL